MRKQYIHLILIILISSQSQMFTQSGFKVMEIDNSEYPKMKSNYYLFDQLGLPIRNLKINDFVVRDNGVNVKSITNHYCDATNYDTTKLSVTLSFDLALNTDGDFNNFELGKRLSKNIASKIDYNEISLVSYNIRTYLNREFTDTLDYILSEINNFNPDIGSLFNTTFLDEPANVFKIISRANYKKIIILITDGSGNIEENLINTLADDNNIKIYSLVIGKKIPESLKRITIKSGGIFIDNINPNIDFDLISNIINAHGKGYLPCQLDWESDYSCTEEHYINVSIPSLSLKDSLLIDFPNLEKSSIIADPSFLGFSSVDSGKTKKLSLTITAKNRDIFIQELKINQPFTIIEGNVSNYLLLKDNFLNLTIEYKPERKAIVFSELEIISDDACIKNPIYITGGYPNTKPVVKTIEITHPTEGETLIIGDSSFVSWLGLLPKDVIQLEYSTDNGRTWKLLKRNTNGLKVDWLVPNEKSDSCLVKIIQLWPHNIGKTLDLKHDDELNSAFFNDEGDLIVTASSDSTAIVWTANTGQPKFILKGHTQPVSWAQFDPSDRFVVTCSKDSTIKIWSLVDGSLIKTLNEHKSKVESVSWCNNGINLVSADYSGEVIIWDTTWTVQKKIKSNNGPTWFACFNPVNNELVATANNGGKVKVWNWKNYNPGDKETILYDSKSINCKHVTYNFDGTKMATATSSAEPKKVFIWDTSLPNAPIFGITHNNDTSSNASINFSSFFLHPELNRELILTSSTDQTARLWYADDGSIVEDHQDILDNLFKEHRNSVQTAVFDKYGSRVLTSSWDSTAKVWNLKKDTLQVDISPMFRIDSIKALTRDILFGEIPYSYLKDSIIHSVFINKSNFKFKIFSIRIGGENPNDFSINDDLVFPTEILPGDSLDIEIRFFPTDYGVRKADLIFDIPTKNMISKIEGVAFAQTLHANSPLIDFSQVRLGNFKDTTFAALLTNITGASVLIDTIEMVGSYKNDFSIKKGFDAKSLNANSDLLLSIRFNPINLGRKNAQILVTYKDKGSPTIINLFGEGIESRLDSISIQIANASGEPGELVSVPIYLKNLGKDGFNNNLEGIYTYLKFNSTLLEPIGVFEEDIISGYERTIKLLLPVNMVKDTILGKVDFRVAFGNDTISPLKLEYSYPASNSYIYIDEQSGTFLIKNLCFDNGLRLFDPDGLISLKQNTPNPVNETTKISFEIIENSNTQLIVIDILGNTVMELVNKVLPIGKYEVEVNANQLNTGTYNYILRTSTKTLIRNMQVIKK